ncbi:MAG: hypothetical protein LC740_16915, partial [Actinobacteria bacterium]|nr:hypothetical protein [Actinomycetota bacterium]
MKANFNKWWLLPSGILVFSVLVALGIVAFKPAFIDRSYVQVAQRVGSEPALTGEAARDCSGEEASDYS